MGHADRKLFHRERWLWDERRGLIKPERSSKIAAEGIAGQFYKIVKRKKQIIRIKNEPIFAQIPIPIDPNENIVIDDQAIEVDSG